MKKYIVLAMVLPVLSGCLTLSPEQAEANKRQQCANMGAPPGSKDYYQCRRDLEHARLAEKKIDQDALDNYQAITAYQNKRW